MTHYPPRPEPGERHVHSGDNRLRMCPRVAALAAIVKTLRPGEERPLPDAYATHKPRPSHLAHMDWLRLSRVFPGRDMSFSSNPPMVRRTA